MSYNYVSCSTLTFQISVHIRLLIFRKKSELIRVYTFIRFVANPPYTIFIRVYTFIRFVANPPYTIFIRVCTFIRLIINKNFEVIC